MNRMLVAFDFDDTVSADPLRFNLVAWAMVHAGHQVVILTAGAGELPPAERPAAMAERIRRHGFTCPHELACCPSADKGRWCRDRSVDVMIDDRGDVLDRVAADSPKTLRLQVR